MKSPFVRKAISTKLNKQIEEMISRIDELFGMDITKIQASKIVAWKAKSYNINLTEKKLIKIMGDKDE